MNIELLNGTCNQFADLQIITGDLACVQLLICQMAPVLRRMQGSVTGRIEGKEKFDSNFGESVEGTLLQQLPSIEELRDHGHDCERRYAKCDLRSVV